MFIFLIFLVFCAFTQTTGIHFKDDNFISDPCGMVKLKGRYHLFYQYFDRNGEEKFYEKLRWGHASSAVGDLLNWQIHPKVLNYTKKNGPTIFRGKVVKNPGNLVPFSGSAILDSTNVTGLLRRRDEPLLLIYTSLSQHLIELFDSTTNQYSIISTVYMFYSYDDGQTFIKYPKPMISHSDTIRNFRDPMVFRFKKGHFNLLMEENTNIAIHSSSDLINWKKTSVFNYPFPEGVRETEMPNLVRVGKDWFMVFSINQDSEGSKYFLSSVNYLVGSFDGYKFTPYDNHPLRQFDGPDLYAITISEDHIIMAMLNNWLYGSKLAYNNTLAYPRKIGKLTHDNLTYMTQEFVNLRAFNRTLIDYRRDDSANNIEIGGNHEGFSNVEHEYVFNFTVNKPHHIKIKLFNFKCSHACDLEFKFVDTNNIVKIEYNYESNDFYLDRSESKKTQSNFPKMKNRYQKILENNWFDLDLILDMNSIELLTDRGLVSISALHLNNHIFQSFILTAKHNYLIDHFQVSYYG